MSPRKVATSTSIKRPSPSGSSRSQIACTIASPIQRTPNIVAAIAQDTCSRRGRPSASRNVTGKPATRTITTWLGSP